MPIGPSGRRHEPLNVVPMALALMLAAFLGGSLGLLWHSFGGADDVPVETAGVAAAR